MLLFYLFWGHHNFLQCNNPVVGYYASFGIKWLILLYLSISLSVPLELAQKRSGGSVKGLMEGAQLGNFHSSPKARADLGHVYCSPCRNCLPGSVYLAPEHLILFNVGWCHWVRALELGSRVEGGGWMAGWGPRCWVATERWLEQPPGHRCVLILQWDHYLCWAVKCSLIFLKTGLHNVAFVTSESHSTG